MTTTKRKKRKRTGRYYWVAAAVLCLLLCVVMLPARAAENRQTYKAETADGVNVTVTADEKALPDGAKLSVKKIDSDDKQFNDVAQKVLTEKNVTGLLAYDIRFVKDGKEVEPDGKVNVNMTWDKAAALSQSDDADISVFHLKENDKGKIVKVDDLTDKDSTTIKQNKSAIESVKFQTDSLSPFTITWTTTKNNDAGEKQTYRIASVTIRYVDENGLTVNTADEFTPEEMEQWSKTDNGIVNLSDWANKDGNSRVKDYTYDHAALRSRDGQTVTGLKAKQSRENLSVRTGYDEATKEYTYQKVETTVYRLYYTTDEDVNKINPNANTWTLFEDYGTDTYANNSFVYLVYKKNSRLSEKSVIVHFMTLDGQEIKDSDNKAVTKTIYASDLSGDLDFVNWIPQNAPQGYKINTNKGAINVKDNSNITRVTVNSPTAVFDGTESNYLRWLKYDKDDEGNYDFYAGRGNKNYSTPGKMTEKPVNIYITLQGSGIAPTPKKDTITLHYQYVNKSGSYGDAYYGDDANNTTKTISVKSDDKRTYLVTDPDKNGAYVDTIYNGKVWRNPEGSESGPQPLIFMNARLGGSDGPTVNSVDMSNDGKLIYHTSMSGTADPDDNSANPTSWTLSQASGAQKGRSISITKGADGYLKLIDSLTGDIPINLVNDEAGTGDARVGETYKGTLQNATTDVDYVVTTDYFTRTNADGSTTKIPRYSVEVTNSYPSTSTDVYQIYIDGKNDQDKIWIEDDMKYTGLFRLDVSDGLRKKLTEANDKNAVIEWHRLTTKDEYKSKIPKKVTSSPVNVDDVKDEMVYRKISGEHWNLALNPNERTWLDIEADEGTDVWEKGTTRAYYAKVTYTPENSNTPVTLYTTPLTVNYYGQLENGSFEDPKVSEHNNNENDPNKYTTGFYGGQTSNAWYKSAGGVWQTTGPGSTRNSRYEDRDIEIVDATNHSTLNNSYHWQGGDDSKTSWAADGNQFAELNAENAGALYQDVITHPNEKINYWLSHRARGNIDADRRDYHYDTMYVVIMPTKLAMTMGKDGTELRTQDELQNFISKHGGFDSEVIKAPNNGSKEESTLTYYDEDSGVMIYKVRSDENGWHNVAINSKYTAKGGLTRFFFAAASTAADKGRGEQTPSVANDPPTMGNFIDNVGFNQQLPPTKGFNLTVTETFSGITMEQLAGLATNAHEYNGQKGITAQTNPLQVTLTNTRTSSSSSGNASPNDALNGAKLGFTMSYDNNKNLVLTPTAKLGETDLFTASDTITKPGSGEVHRYPDGRIVITWKFPDQLLQVGMDSTLHEIYNYTANDNMSPDNSQRVSTTDINGLTKTTSQNAVNNKDKSVKNANTTGQVSSSITTESDETLNIVNVYSPNVHISVRKTFTGVTPTTVNEIMNGTGKSNGKKYAITITKGSGDGAPTKVLKVDGGYRSDGTTKDKDNSVTVSSSQGSDGSTTYKWDITDPSWQDATYHVQEDNYTTSRNTLSDIKLNGISVKDKSSDAWPSDESKKTVTVKANDEANINFEATTRNEENEENRSVIDLTKAPFNGSLPDTTMNSNTNLVVGQYTLVTTEKSEEGSETPTTHKTKKYIVWTSSEVGLTTRNAIIKHINDIWGESADDKATTKNTSFYSGDNVYVVQDGRIARMVNQQSASLTGQSEEDTWDSFYAAHMTADSNGSSVDESEIRIDNEYTPKIKIQKQSAETTANDDTHRRLNGAEFRIYKMTAPGTGPKLYLQNTISNNESDLWKSDTSTAKTFTTETDGSSDNLGEGIAMLDTPPADNNTTYYLEESKAPDGYQKISDIAFKVRSSGTVVLVDQTPKVEGVDLTFIDPYYTFIINDTPGEALPNTGGTGIALFIIIGLVIAICATAAIAKRRQNLKG